MQNTINDFTQSTTDAALLEMEQSELYVYAIHSPGPEDENEDENDDDNNDDNKGKSKGSVDDDPPIDEDVVHSPLPPQTGGKPRKQL